MLFWTNYKFVAFEAFGCCEHSLIFWIQRRPVANRYLQPITQWCASILVSWITWERIVGLKHTTLCLGSKYSITELYSRNLLIINLEHRDGYAPSTWHWKCQILLLNYRCVFNNLFLFHFYYHLLSTLHYILISYMFLTYLSNFVRRESKNF